MAAGAEAAVGDGTLEHENIHVNEVPDRKAARKAAKAQKRANREGRGDPTVGQKPCALCSRKQDLLIRCQHDASGSWNLVCGRCWNLDSVAGGVVDGSGSNPHYRYGGLWKNLRKQSGGAKLPSSEQELLSLGDLALSEED